MSGSYHYAGGGRLSPLLAAVPGSGPKTEQVVVYFLQLLVWAREENEHWKLATANQKMRCSRQ